VVAVHDKTSHPFWVSRTVYRPEVGSQLATLRVELEAERRLKVADRCSRETWNGTDNVRSWTCQQRETPQPWFKVERSQSHD